MLKSSRLLLKAGLVAGALAASTQAGAVNFVLNDTGGTAVGTQARKGFEIATAYWSSVLRDDITVTLNIGFNQLAPGVLGSTGSTTAVAFVEDVYSALVFDATSAADVQAVTNLSRLTTSPSFGAGGVTVIANEYSSAAQTSYTDTATRVDNDGSANNVALSANTSVLKALGYNVAGGADGSVTFNSDFAFDFNPADGLDEGSFDFINVAIHEIGHALGFRSGVDLYDAYTRPGGTASLRPGALDTYAVATVLDLFRYSGDGELDWSTSAEDKYFSLDGGRSELFGEASFALGVRNGDGRQASHWKDAVVCTPQLGIMDPTICRNTLGEITALDLAAFDAMGWDVAFDVLANPDYVFTTADAYTAFVPEPSTWGMMIAGFGLVGMGLRRRQGRTAVTA